jgi:cytochrome P450
MDGKTHVLDATHTDWTIHINSVAQHTYPSIWGDDSLEFRPSRWITAERGELFTPDRGVYNPWGNGQRLCPGQKFSQVEIVSVLTAIFRTCRVEPVVEAGETMQQARDRIKAVVQDTIQKMTLTMNKPEELHLRWAKR